MRIPIHNSQQSRAAKLALAMGWGINIDHRGKAALIINQPTANIFKIHRGRGRHTPRKSI
jgi:hypothetical protein